MHMAVCLVLPVPWSLHTQKSRLGGWLDGVGCGQVGVGGLFNRQLKLHFQSLPLTLPEGKTKDKYFKNISLLYILIPFSKFFFLATLLPGLWLQVPEASLKALN